MMHVFWSVALIVAVVLILAQRPAAVSSSGSAPRGGVPAARVARGGGLTCPACGTPAQRGGFPLWAILVSIVFFPFGLLALLVGRKPSACHCGAAFVA